MIAAIITFVINIAYQLDNWAVEGTWIFAVVIVITTLKSIIDYYRQYQLQQIQKQTTINYVTVIRSGQKKLIASTSVLTGDVIQFQPNDIIIGDGVLISGNNVFVDESSISGEGKPVPKSFPKTEFDCPFLMSSSVVLEGEGKYLICAVGDYSCEGRMRGQMQDIDGTQTQLFKQMVSLANKMTLVGIVVGAIIFAILLFIILGKSTNQDDINETETQLLVNASILSLIFAASLIPQGFPLVLAISTIYTVIKLKAHGVYIRNLKGCEVMGSVTDIVTDKTGTITENTVNVLRGFFDVIDIEIDQAPKHLSEGFLQTLSECVMRNIKAYYVDDQNGVKAVGTRNECALLDMVHRISPGVVYDGEWEFVESYSYTLDTRISTSVYQNLSNDRLVYCKGSPECIIPLCKYKLNMQGYVEQISSEDLASYNEICNVYQASQLNCFGLAYQLGETRGELRSEMVFVCILGLSDIIRAGSIEGIMRLQERGVNIHMVTGDTLQNAIQIAQQGGIISSDINDFRQVGIDASDFRQLVGNLEESQNPWDRKYKVQNQHLFNEYIQSFKVIARCSPQDKLLIVAGLQNMNKTVAYVGDGSNDALAITNADIGVSMFSGTELTKNCSEVILLNDNFNGVVEAIEWGRNMYSGVRRFVQYQISMNLVLIIVNVAGLLYFGLAPFSTVQVLFANFVLVTFGVLALATESPEKMAVRPEQDEILTREVGFHVLAQSIYQSIVLIGVALLQEEDLDNITGKPYLTGKSATVLYHLFLMLQIFNLFNARILSTTELNVFKNITKNQVFIPTIIIAFIVEMLLITLGQGYFNVQKLELNEHILCIGLGCSTILYMFLVKVLNFTIQRNGKQKGMKGRDKEAQPFLKNQQLQFNQICWISQVFYQYYSQRFGLNNVTRIQPQSPISIY